MIKRVLPGLLFISFALASFSQPVHKIAVNFDFGLATINSDAANMLDNLVTYLKAAEETC